MAAIQSKRVLEFVEALAGGVIATVDQPAVSRQQRGRTEVTITVPPVTRAAGRATGAQDAGRRLVDELLVFLALQALPIRRRRRARLQPRLDGGVLRIEIGQVADEVLDDRQVRQWIDPDITFDTVDRACAGQRVAAIDVHRTGTADALATRATKRQRRVNLVLDLDERVQHHRAAAVEIDLVGIEARVVSAIRVVAIDGEAPDVRGAIRRREVSAFLDSRVLGESDFSHSRSSPGF